MRTESWLRLMSSLVLVGVFAAGVLFGAGLMRFNAPATDPTPYRPPPRGGPIGAMTHELGLDAEQVAALDAIAEAHRAELEALGRETQQRVRKVLRAIEDELVPRLRPDQRAKLDSWRKTRRAPPGGHPVGPLGGPPGGGPPGGPPPWPPPGGDPAGGPPWPPPGGPPPGDPPP